MLIMVIMAIMVNIVIMVIMVIMVIKVIVVIMVTAIIANSNFGSQCSKNLSKLLLERFWCSFTLFHPYVHLLEVTTAN